MLIITQQTIGGWNMSRALILVTSLALGFIFAVGIAEVVAQSPGQSDNSTQTAKLQSRFAFLDILDSDSRSKQFAALRTKRSDITRNIFKLEQDLRETQASAESLQRSIQEFRARRELPVPPYFPLAFPQNSELERQTFERENQTRSYDIAIAQVDRDIALLRSRITPDQNEVERKGIEAEILDLENRKLKYSDSNKLALSRIDFEIDRIKKQIVENNKYQDAIEKQNNEEEAKATDNIENMESELTDKTKKIAGLRVGPESSSF
jgi:hypothetical protein